MLQTYLSWNPYYIKGFKSCPTATEMDLIEEQQISKN